MEPPEIGGTVLSFEVVPQKFVGLLVSVHQFSVREDYEDMVISVG